MKRWLLIFLMVLLPLQMSWAAVSSCCQGEGGATSWSADIDTNPSQKADVQADGDSDPAYCDCEHCHHSNSALIFPPTAAATALPAAHPGVRALLIPPSHIPDTLFKPDWRRSA